MGGDIKRNQHIESELDLREIITILWSEKITIITITLIFSICSVLYAVSLPNQYRATALLAPAQQDAGGLSGMLGQLGGLASLAGVSIGSGKSSESMVAQKIMKSWNFIDSFIEKNKLVAEVYAAEGWRKSSNTLIFDDDIYDSTKLVWLVESDETDDKGPPTSWQLYKKFDEHLVISEDSVTGLVSVSIEFYSPELAKNWLDLYVKAINLHMQKRQVEKVSTNIEYLEDQINKTSIAEMRGVFYTIIEEQIKAKMLAEASPEYAFVTVSPSMIPEKKSGPKRAMICSVGTLLGAMLSVLMVITRYSYRESSLRRQSSKD